MVVERVRPWSPDQGITLKLPSLRQPPNLQFSVDSLVTHTTHNFTSAADLMHEVEGARIYARFRYHHSVIQGRVLGIKVGHQLMHRYFAPVRRFVRRGKFSRRREWTSCSATG